jgi:hypothetical protein
MARTLRQASPGRENFPELDAAFRNLQDATVGIENADGYAPPTATRFLARKGATVEMWEKLLTENGFTDEDVATIVDALNLYHEAWKVTPFNTEGQPRRRKSTTKRIVL